jgi:integrase
MIVRRSTPIDRRITLGPPSDDLPGQLPQMSVEFRNAWGERVQRFDPQQLAALPDDLRALLIDAFREHHAGLALTTRRTAWFALRRFAAFVAQDGSIGAARDVDSAALGRYVIWLHDAGSVSANRRARSRPDTISFDMLRPILLWCQRNRPGRLPVDLAIPYNPFPGKHRQHEPRRRLPAEQLSTILRACYTEIDEIWARFQYGQQIIRLPDLPPKTLRGQGLARWIWRISRIEGGLMPDTATLEQHGIKSATLVKYWGGSRTVSQYFHITTDSLVPFFLGIAIQTAANPDPLRLIKRDCLVPHPLDEHRTIIDWCKPKTGLRFKKAQRRSFDRRRRYAAPNLIEMVLALTEPIVAEAPSGQRDQLFLTRSIFKTLARRTERDRTEVIEHSVLKHAIRRFIVRANRRIEAWNTEHPGNPRCRIENFAPVMFRGSVATEHYRASEGDVLVAQSILNHASPDTTETYLKSVEMTRLQRQTIARLQDLMVAWVTGPRGSIVQPTTAEPRATTPFGHDCLAPMINEAEGTSRLCPHFGGCLACPGLVIPIDADHLARILLAIDRLDEARFRLEPQRWNLLYAPTHRILTQDLLPDFPAEMHVTARALTAAMSTLPELE